MTRSINKPIPHSASKAKTPGSDSKNPLLAEQFTWRLSLSLSLSPLLSKQRRQVEKEEAE
ncbi:conserved hypothetical protein [Ricinus communis]|uniref:Uncharacterized protein n=1 Tax=Ricinus communis TaxID=3988 RepID=B9S0F3_RICCO|nr:conserved hypothetical protein [Ricinus communis]